MSELLGPPSTGRVHVVRHYFEPNQPLASLLETVTGPHDGSRFMLRSSKEVYVDSVPFVRGSYREETVETQRAIEHAKRTPFIIARVAFRLLYHHDNIIGTGVPPLPRSYRIALLPVETQSFIDLTQSLDTYPTVLTPPQPDRHYMYLDLPAEIGRRPRQALAEYEMQKRVSSHVRQGLYSATVTGLRSAEVFRRRA